MYEKMEVEMMLHFVLLEELLKHVVYSVALDIIQRYSSKVAFAKIFQLGNQAGPKITGAAVARLMGY